MHPALTQGELDLGPRTRTFYPGTRTVEDSPGAITARRVLGRLFSRPRHRAPSVTGKDAAIPPGNR
jgi:hypothetical protein